MLRQTQLLRSQALTFALGLVLLSIAGRRGAPEAFETSIQTLHHVPSLTLPAGETTLEQDGTAPDVTHALGTVDPTPEPAERIAGAGARPARSWSSFAQVLFAPKRDP